MATKRTKKAGTSKSGDGRQLVVVPPPNFQVVSLTIMGDSSLIVNNKFTYTNTPTETAPGDQTKPGPKKKPVPSDQEMFDRSRYIVNGKDCFPANGIKQAMVRSCDYVSGLSMTSAKGLFFVFGAETQDFAAIKGKPTMERVMVRRPVGRPGAGSVPIARAEYKDWSMDLIVRFDADHLTLQDVANLVEIAGVHCGIGEWRPSSPIKSGTHGMFHLALSKAKKQRKSA